MAMGCCKLGFVVLAGLCILIAGKSSSAEARAALTLAPLGHAVERYAAPLQQRVLHRKRAQSYYCYPRKYWWFYRPYTTAQEGHLRCMPYFHYLGPSYERRGARAYRHPK
jgi:hypothetical protein